MKRVASGPERRPDAPARAWLSALPSSGAVTRSAFDRRRRLLAGVLLAHVPVLFGMAIFAGVSALSAAALTVPVPTALAALGLVWPRRRLASVAITLGLVWCSTTLVHVTGGAIASHAHAILVVAACTLLQEWWALVWGCIGLAASQGLAPSLGPLVAPQLGLAAGGIHRSWLWAVLEPLLLSGVALPSVVTWKALEDVQAKAADLAFDAERAADQADRRRAQADLLLSLSRRNQTLLELQLEELDVLELDEADPDALAGLFRLDHLATRMRRNAESLLVLSGDESPRVHGSPAPLSEVVRAAIGEVEQYTRVEVVLAEDPLVSGAASADLTHLIAELIDNATTFSTRSSLVVVAGQSTSDGYELRVKDRGRGMTDQALHERNRQLAHPPDLDLELATMLGLHVCGRLAQRLAVGVALERNSNGGTTASVIIPSILLSDQIVPLRPLLAAALAALGADEDEVPEDEPSGNGRTHAASMEAG